MNWEIVEGSNCVLFQGAVPALYDQHDGYSTVTWSSEPHHLKLDMPMKSNDTSEVGDSISPLLV